MGSRIASSSIGTGRHIGAAMPCAGSPKRLTASLWRLSTPMPESWNSFHHRSVGLKATRWQIAVNHSLRSMAGALGRSKSRPPRSSSASSDCMSRRRSCHFRPVWKSYGVLPSNSGGRDLRRKPLGRRFASASKCWNWRRSCHSPHYKTIDLVP